MSCVVVVQSAGSRRPRAAMAGGASQQPGRWPQAALSVSRGTHGVEPGLVTTLPMETPYAPAFTLTWYVTVSGAAEGRDRPGERRAGKRRRARRRSRCSPSTSVALLRTFDRSSVTTTLTGSTPVSLRAVTVYVMTSPGWTVDPLVGLLALLIVQVPAMSSLLIVHVADPPTGTRHRRDDRRAGRRTRPPRRRIPGRTTRLRQRVAYPRSTGALVTATDPVVPEIGVGPAAANVQSVGDRRATVVVRHRLDQRQLRPAGRRC